MKTLPQSGWLAEKHWRTWLPRRVTELQAKGLWRERLREAEEQTAKEMESLRRHFIGQGLTPQQAHDRAWDIVRERYSFLPPEE